MRRFRVFKIGQFWCYLAILIGLSILMHFTHGAGFVVVVPFVFATFFRRKPDSLMFWMVVTVSMLVANSKIVPKDSIVFGLSQRAMLIAFGLIAIVKLMGGRKDALIKNFFIMWIYVIFMVFPSAFGWCPSVSFLKLFLFIVIFMAFIYAANQASISAYDCSCGLRAVILAIGVYFIFGSMAIIPFPAYGQLSPEQFLDNPNAQSLFMGMTSQPQALGPIISAIALIIFSDMLFSIKKANGLYIFLLSCCPYLIYKTSSRTGMGSFLMGFMYALFLFRKARGVTQGWRSRVMTTSWTLAIVAGCMVLCVPSINKKAVEFIVKWGSSTEKGITAEGVMASRQAKIDSSMENFRKKPLFGNGFQVMEKTADLAASAKGMILSAPIEKGVWVTAVLEEGGIIGFVIFSTFLFINIVGLAKRRAYIGSTCLFVCMLTNLGEFSFFSMTYLGGFVWAMVFFGIALDAQRLKNERMINNMRYINYA